MYFSQFGQFDYGQGASAQTPQYPGDGSNPYMSSGAPGGYTGSILTPDPVQPYDAENLDEENEPPLMEGRWSFGVNAHNFSPDTEIVPAILGVVIMSQIRDELELWPCGCIQYPCAFWHMRLLP